MQVTRLRFLFCVFFLMTGLRPDTAPGEALPEKSPWEVNGLVTLTSGAQTSARVGGSGSGSGTGSSWGVWGFAERLHKAAAESNNSGNSRDSHYGELSAIHSIGLWSVSAGGGGGEDPDLRPSSLLLGDIARRFPSARTTVYAGHTRTAYNGTNKSLYRFYRIGSLVDVLQSLNLNINLQILERSVPGESTRRLGSSGGVSLTGSKGEHQIGASAAASCLGNQFWCKGGPLERYAEFFINGRIAMAPDYGLIGKLGYTTASSGNPGEPAASDSPRRGPSTQIWFGGYQKL
jgi:hypothetical protein